MRSVHLTLWFFGMLAAAPSLPAQSLPGCGDGMRTGAEQCDDGNPFGLDGCDSACRFEQTHRMNSLSLRYATDVACANNQFGSAFVGGNTRNAMQSSLTSSIADGRTTVVLHMLGLDDASGAADTDTSIGVVNGAPVQPGAIPYDGTNDLDWWYLPGTGQVIDQAPVVQLSAVFQSSTLVTAPGAYVFTTSFAGAPANIAFWDTTLDADVGPVSKPLVSSGNPPGHLPSENLDPAFQSFATLTGGVMCGKLDAESLRNTAMPAALVGCSFLTCAQCYTPSNSFLDLMIGGCTIVGIAQVQATQPDTFVAAAPPAGNGPPYRFTRTGNTVTGCLAANSPAPLSACLRSAAYSTYLGFTTDRVILRAPSPRVFADGFEG